MRKATILGILLLLLSCVAPSVFAEKIVVGYQPYTWYPWPAIIEEMGLAKKYLPPGTEVEIQGAIHGAILSNNMLANKMQVGYMATMPACIACSRNEDIRIVSCITYSNGMDGSNLMVRSDAPDFKTPEDAVKWLDGKIVATPKGSVSDQFLRMCFEKFGIKPAEYLNQTFEIITTNFRAKKIDASAVWEPTASRIGTWAGDGVARYVACGNVIKSPDLAVIIMRGDFIDKHPDLAEGWLKANLEAEQFVMDLKNQKQVVEMAAKHEIGMPKRAIWYSIYGEIPPSVGGTNPRWTFPLIVDDQVRQNVKDLWAFGTKDKLIATDKTFADVIDDKIARKILAESGLKLPIGEVNGQPPENNPFK